MTTTPNSPAIPGMAVALATFMCVGGAVSFSYRSRDHVVPRESAPISHAPDVPSDPPTDLDGKDSQFLNLLSLKGFNHQDLSNAINDAHRVCSPVALGDSEQQIVQDIFEGSQMSMLTATNFADVAIRVYCPQARFGRRDLMSVMEDHKVTIVQAGVALRVRQSRSDSADTAGHRC